MAYTIGRYGIGSLFELAQLTLEVWAVSIVFVLGVLGAISAAAGFNILKFLRYIREEILITLGTSSSEAVLAPLITKMERLGCAKPIVGMVMPAGYTFNADGTSILSRHVRIVHRPGHQHAFDPWRNRVRCCWY